MNRKLFIIEGIPGSGKTTTATWLANVLRDQGKETQLFLEGNPHHPADYESVACLNEQQFNELETEFPIIRNFAAYKGDWHFIPYAQLAESNPILYKALQKFDAYELSVEDFMEVTLMRWQDFAEKALTENTIYVLECCFLQNPFTFLLAKHDVSKELIFKHIENIAKKISNLNPFILYFEQDDIKDSLDRVRKERSVDWFEFLTWYYTEQAYGKSRGIKGEAGVIQFLEERKKLEKKTLSQLSVDSLILTNSQLDWDKCKGKILSELEMTVS
jgi:hypothetical protein